MKGVRAEGRTSARARSRCAAALLTALIVAGSLVPLLDSSTGIVVAESLPGWSKVLRMHEGVPSSSSDYDWLNTSDPQNLANLDYDGDGLLGITIRKNLPSNRWRHFWALDPAVNQDVRIQGDIDGVVWAASRDNESASQLTVSLSDMAPGQWSTPSSWTLVGETTVALAGPIYSAFKAYNITIPSVDYTLLDGHRLVMTIMRGDSLNDGLLILYDNSAFDSRIILPVLDFVSVADAWTEDVSGVPFDTFSDTESVVVRANVTNPFGVYDTEDAECTVSYASNGTVVVPRTPMALVGADATIDSAWAEYSLTVGPLSNGSYSIQVNGSDSGGSPTWMNLSVTVVSVDHFIVDVPASVVTDEVFAMNVSAADSEGYVIPNWRGTVDLDVFEEDTVTPAGPLSNSSVEFTGDEGGVVTITDQTYSLGEGTVLIRASSAGSVGWSAPIVVFSGPVVRISIEPGDDQTVTAGDSVHFTATGYDLDDRVNSTWTPVWTVVGAVGSLVVEGFSATLVTSSAGEGTVLCEDVPTGVSASVEVEVVAGVLDAIVITPAGPLSIKEGQAVTFTAVGYDVNDNIVPLNSPTWYTTTSGSITGSGSTVSYTAGFIPETGVVNVSVGSVSDSVSVTVTNALNGPWLSAIPSQIANEDTTWSISLASYWNHANGTSALRWYAEGVDSSIYLVTHDPSSEAIVGFITQPDKYGTDTFRLWVRDPDGFSTYQDVVVSIQPVNDKPAFIHTPPTEYYVKFDTSYSFDFDYYVYDVDNAADELSMLATESDWGAITFEGFVSSFLFREKSGTTSYFETMKLTLTDAGMGETVDSTNSAYLNIVVWVTDDTPPSLVDDLPDIDYLMEGDIDVMVFDLDEYFVDVDEDVLIYKYGFENIEVYIDSATHEVFMSAPYEWSGVTDGTFTAVDPVGAFKTDTVTVTVSPVNDDPTVYAINPLFVHYDVEYTLDASLYVYDPDHSFSELTFSFTSEYVSISDGLIRTSFPASLSGGAYVGEYMVSVTLTVEDPEGGTGLGGFSVTVSDNHPPALASPVPYPDLLSFPEDSYLNGSVDLTLLFIDADSDELEYSVGCTDGLGCVGVTINPDGTVNFTASANWSGYEVIRFTATDPDGAWTMWTVTVVVTPVNDAPVVSPIGDKTLVGWPRNFQMFICQYIYDIETPYVDLEIISTPEAYVSVVGRYIYVSIPEDLDRISVTIYAVDSDGARSDSVTFTITLTKTIAETIGYPFTLPLVLLAAGVASYFVASRMPRPYSLENLFLIHNDGRLVAHVTRHENTNIDKDVVSAMFTAVQEFVRDSFQAGETGLKRLEIGDKNVMIEKGRSVYLAMIYSGWPPKEVFESITMLLRDIEERFDERLVRWNGTSKAVKGVDGMLQSFMSYRFKPGSWTSEEDLGEQEWVDILDKET